MTGEIHRDSLSAWNALRHIGGLEADNRDKDFVGMLQRQLDPTAPDLETALAATSIDQFMKAFFVSIQPFALMFRDILSFFERSNASEGQSQLRVVVGDEFLDWRHFVEFLESWRKLDVLLDVPVLDRSNAFLLNTLRIDFGGYDFLIGGFEHDEPANTGFPDVDDWLTEYDAGRYAPFPSSLMPEHLPKGLSGASSLILAAVSTVRQRGLTRPEMIEEHRARSYKSVAEDALHPWTIAQKETEFWLRLHVGYLASIRRLTEQEQQSIPMAASERFSQFPRRGIPGTIETKELERLLSLPAWKQRYETYGVWIATQIIDALENHDVVVNNDNGELKFAFAEARIADVKTSMPAYSLYTEKRVPLANPVGNSRKKAVQPDFSIWKFEAGTEECVLVVEVKHYKKRSRSNFRDALIDYGRAHPQADVLLVNYGPVGKEFTDMPIEVADRCQMIGPLTPETNQTLIKFRDIVSNKVGEPVLIWQNTGPAPAHELIALDVSHSMEPILASSDIQKFFSKILEAEAAIAMIDQDVREICKASEVDRWKLENQLGQSTSLASPVEALLLRHARIIVITDEDGLRSLKKLNPERIASPLSEASNAIFVRLSRQE